MTAPGTWIHSSRVSRVRIVPMEKPDCALSIENNWFHLWNLTKTESPVCSEKASSSPLFAIEWNPHQLHTFMVAGASRNLKLLDSRTLKVNTQESVVREIFLFF